MSECFPKLRRHVAIARSQDFSQAFDARPETAQRFRLKLDDIYRLIDRVENCLVLASLLAKARQQDGGFIVLDQALHYFLDYFRDAIFRIIQAALRCRSAFEGISAPPLQLLLVCLHIGLDHARIGKRHA
ncbi:hypothetical protein [Agrobacterium tumefaciens]|uniref:hypothetical protein n=1 Tax=Agrobacterium tumefaciens TaxID=358 RepID=UPI001F43CE0F